MTIRDLLKGTVPGKVQTVGAMQMIPLISEVEFDGFVSPGQNGTFRTTGYGRMQFNNDSEKTMIVPNHIAYLTKHAAQDHAMMHSGIIKKRSSKEYQDAACIQQRQGGYVPADKHDFVFLPFSIRETASDVRHENSYGKMWPSIQVFNSRAGTPGDGSGHLEYFYSHYSKELDEFAAEFEPIQNQIGAIILINGSVIGIERTPNHEYWKSVWSRLIRGCYASYVIECTREKKITKATVEKTRVPLDISKINSIEDIYEQFQHAETQQAELVSAVVRSLVDDAFSSKEEESESTTKRIFVNNKQFSGDVIADNGVYIYCSLVSRKAWIKNEKYHSSSEFKI